MVQTPPSDEQPATKLPAGWLPGWSVNPKDEAGRRNIERTARVFGYCPFFAQINELRSDMVFRPLKEWEPRLEPAVTDETVQRFRLAIEQDHDEEAA